MSNTINLVKGDTGPDITITLYDSANNAPIDVSGGSDVVRLHVVREGQTGTPVVTTIVGVKPNGGADGVITFVWPAGALSAAGYYEAEVKITFTSGKVETVPDKLRFYARENLA